MSTTQVYEHYEQYVREYRSVLHLADQILEPRGWIAPAPCRRAGICWARTR